MPFAIALSGLNAASADLGVTANNVANVNTTGFKMSRGEFSEVFAVGTQSVGSTASGSGVRLSAVSQQFAQGNIDFTDNALDLAIGGEGFFILSDNGARTYTRAGAFGVNDDGYVVNAQGRRLQAYPASGNGLFNTGTPDDLRLTTGASPPRATESTTLGVNLPADAEAPASGTFDPADPSSFNHTTSITVYDSLGAAHTATVYFIKDPAVNTWNTEVEIDGVTVSGGTQAVFNEDGSLASPANGQMQLSPWTPGNGAGDIELTLNFAETTQFGNAFGVNSLTQDGYTTGRLTGVSVDAEGVVFARFTNGQSTSLGKLALANFANPQGLQQVGDTAWAASSASGDPLLGEAGTATFGNIQSGALESSNVDLTAELVKMITSQKNFQANAQMISVADTVTQTVINIR